MGSIAKIKKAASPIVAVKTATSEPKPILPCIYCVTTIIAPPQPGKAPKKEAIGCLILPQMENIDVPIESFDNGRNNDIIKLVEKLPKKVYSVVEAQYKKNEDPDNRRQQLNTPNVSYSESTVEEDKDTHRLPSK